jgi:alkanesulfonate monooxygenase SsuD/methylene tetrahydromethanopterin reductase-like flavin-dependent oxidoreductase (luciferase family)
LAPNTPAGAFDVMLRTFPFGRVATHRIGRRAVMTRYGHDLRFGAFITPNVADAAKILELARLADREGLDLVTFQDHPYQGRFLDAFTLMAVVAAQTERISVAPNVANLPLRGPVLIAKGIASLDVLSGGRAELALGAGALWDRIAGVGGQRRTPGESVDALSEAIDVIRGLWTAGDEALHVEGEHYRLDGADRGPAPAHRAEIWLGAYKPRMLRLTGAKADGWVPSASYAPPEALGELNAEIDQAAERAGRDPGQIRRLYNVNAKLTADDLVRIADEHGTSTFILMTDEADGIRRFANEVAPRVREFAGRG